MTAPPGFHAEHLREQPRRLALRNVREIGDKAISDRRPCLRWRNRTIGR